MNKLTARQLIADIPTRSGGSPLDVSFAPGQTWGILGPNGVGKTTLLHTLAGLRPPRSGRVLLGDHPLTDLGRKSIARQVGLIFQDQQDGFPATVLETVLIGRHPYLSPWAMEKAKDHRIAREALERLGLADLIDRDVRTLSGGERQRVAVATVLAQAPRIWLADEPTNHLDLYHQVMIMELLVEMAGAGHTVLLCLHDLNLAARWCDHLLLLYPDGRARAGSTTELLTRENMAELYQQPLVTGRVGGSRVFVPARDNAS